MPFPHSSVLPALAPLSLAVIALYLKSFATTVVQARERLRTRLFAFREDAEQWQGEEDPKCSVLHHRASSALRNDRENVPYFFALGLCYALLGGPAAPAWCYFGGFVVARCAHTYCFLAQLQPLRNRAFSVSIAALVCLAGHTAYLTV